MPELRCLSVAEMHSIADARHWNSIAGLEMLSRDGLLFHADVFDDGRTFPSWVITDASRRNAQARRLDGDVWKGINGAKAKSIPMSQASWPIGAANIGHRTAIVLEEQRARIARAHLRGMGAGTLPLKRIKSATRQKRSELAKFAQLAL